MADGSQVVEGAVKEGRRKFQEAAAAGVALKFDDAKPRMELLPTDALEEIAKVLSFGATKYAAHNWCKGMAWGRLLGAAFRHLGAYTRGEDLDPETGLSHLAHAACCILFLIAYRKRNVGEDDRFKV